MPASITPEALIAEPKGLLYIDGLDNRRRLLQTLLRDREWETIGGKLLAVHGAFSGEARLDLTAHASALCRLPPHQAAAQEEPEIGRFRFGEEADDHRATQDPNAWP